MGINATAGNALPGRPRFDLSIVALVIAGTSTFLNVYTTQALLPFLRHVYQASELEVSLTISATTFGVALSAPLVGLFAESWGRKKVIVPSIFILSIPTALAATSPNLQWLILWRFLMGLCIPGIIAVVIAYINEEFVGRGVGRAMSAYVAGTVFGGFLGRLIPGLVATHWQWRYAFLVLAVLNLLGGLAVRSWLPPAENFVAAETIHESLRDARTHLKNYKLLAVFGLGFMVLFGLVGVFTYVNFYLAGAPYRLNPAQLGSIFLVYLLGIIVTPLAGRFLDRAGFFKTMMLAVVVSSCGLLTTLTHRLSIIIVGLALFSSGMFVQQAAATSQTGRIATRGRSVAAGLYVTVYYIGGSVGAVVPAYFWAHYGWPGCVAVLWFSSAVTLVLAWVSAR
jgi:MFS transporter, YNFM family, putative membrane transport protein